MRLTIRFMLFLAALGAAAPEAFAFERVPYEVAKALKIQSGKSIDSGLVFVDGKFLKPPYRVKRYGNQIMINTVPVTGPLVSWEELLKTQDHVKVTEAETGDGGAPSSDAKPSAAPAEDGVDPAAPKDGGTVAPSADDSAQVVRTIEPLRVAADGDLDDFNPSGPDTMKLKDIPADTEEDVARRKRLAEEKKAEEEAEKEAEKEDEESKPDESTGAGESSAESSAETSDEPLDPASPEGEAAAKKAVRNPPPAAPKKTRKVYSLEGPFEMNYRAKQLMKPIVAERAKIETILKRGGYIFFTTHARRVAGEEFGTRKILEKLPKLMRDQVDDPVTFCDAVRSAGLMSYMSYQNAQDLYRNKTDFAALMERRRSLAEADKLKKLMKR